MARSFAIEEDGSGWEVVDDRGTAWASFAAANPNGAFLSQFMLALARDSYALGVADAGLGRPRTLDLHRGRWDGLRTWDVRVGGPGGACVARDGRHPAQLLPPRRARLMLALARCLYDVAGADIEGSGEAPVQGAGPSGTSGSAPAEGAAAGLR